MGKLWRGNCLIEPAEQSLLGIARFSGNCMARHRGLLLTLWKWSLVLLFGVELLHSWHDDVSSLLSVNVTVAGFQSRRPPLHLSSSSI